MAAVVVLAWVINTYVAFPGSIRPLLNAVLALLIVGMTLWLVNTYVPMAGSIKAILNIFVVTVTCIRILEVLGLWAHIVRLWRNFTGGNVSS
jgi:predicted membrane protein